MRARQPIAFASLLLCVFSLSSLCSAQRGSGSTNTSGNSSRTTSTPTIVNPPSAAPQLQPVIYNGRVHVSGPPLMDAAKIVARCTGSKTVRGGIYSAYTDLKGNFSLTLGQTNQAAVMDASVDPMDPMMDAGRMTVQMLSCEVTAIAAGYISSQMTVQIRNSLDNTEMGKLTLEPIGGTKDLGGIVSVTTLSAPDNAQREYAKGVQDLKDHKIDKAEKHFKKATDEYPKFAIAWQKLGQMQSDAQKPDDARASFQHAIDSDAKFVPPYIDLAVINAMQKKWEDVAKLTARATSIDSQHFPEAYFLDGVANLNLGNNAVAEKSALRAEELDKQHAHPRIQLLLAEICSRSGRREAAVDHLKKYLALDPSSQEAATARDKLAKLEAPPSK